MKCRIGLLTSLKTEAGCHGVSCTVSNLDWRVVIRLNAANWWFKVGRLTLLEMETPSSGDRKSVV